MGKPAKVSPSHSPFLAMCRGADNKICTQSQKKHHPSGWCFLFGMPRAGLNSLPRPARSALNQEVRQGSCEWLCHSWDAGSESSLVARSKKKHHPSGWCFLFGMPRAGLKSLPRPARSALNQEVRQGSCEWLCHSWDAGSESSLIARSKKEETHIRVSLLFWSCTFAMQKWSPAGG